MLTKVNYCSTNPQSIFKGFLQQTDLFILENSSTGLKALIYPISFWSILARVILKGNLLCIEQRTSRISTIGVGHIRKNIYEFFLVDLRDLRDCGAKFNLMLISFSFEPSWSQINSRPNYTRPFLWKKSLINATINLKKTIPRRPIVENPKISKISVNFL